MKTTVIHHSADFDGIFCREIARRFLGEEDVKYIGWDFKDMPLEIPAEGTIYVMDLPVDRVFGLSFDRDGNNTITVEHGWLGRVIWIDHHKTSIDTHPESIPGYRIDGVAACRLAWQWFLHHAPQSGSLGTLPQKRDFVERLVPEPLAVRLAGEYDIWDKRDPNAEALQYGLRALGVIPWSAILSDAYCVKEILLAGRQIQSYQRKVDADVVNQRSFFVHFDGLKFLALNTARCNSLTFDALDVPKTGHDALMNFTYSGGVWVVSLYHANHRKDIDLSAIAKKHGGGWHRGACGFQIDSLDKLGQMQARP